MKKETRTVAYDDELRMEAYCFEGSAPETYREIFSGKGGDGGQYGK